MMMAKVYVFTFRNGSVETTQKHDLSYLLLKIFHLITKTTSKAFNLDRKLESFFVKYKNNNYNQEFDDSKDCVEIPSILFGNNVNLPPKRFDQRRQRGMNENPLKSIQTITHEQSKQFLRASCTHFAGLNLLKIEEKKLDQSNERVSFLLLFLLKVFEASSKRRQMDLQKLQD